MTKLESNLIVKARRLATFEMKMKQFDIKHKRPSALKINSKTKF